MIAISNGSADDIDGVMAVMNNAFDPVFGEAWTRSQLLSALVMPQTGLIIAKREQIIAGFALTRTVLDEWELLMIAVHSSIQRSSVASKLINKVIDAAYLQQSSTIFLEVRSGNPAQRFYEKMGFCEIGRRNNYYSGADGDSFDAITMRYCPDSENDKQD